MPGASHTQGHQPTGTEGLFSVVCARILATSGGKVVRVDRLEWLNIPDAMTLWHPRVADPNDSFRFTETWRLRL